jgi:hypothetical protein
MDAINIEHVQGRVWLQVGPARTTLNHTDQVVLHAVGYAETKVCPPSKRWHNNVGCEDIVQQVALLLRAWA